MEQMKLSINNEEIEHIITRHNRIDKKSKICQVIVFSLAIMYVDESFPFLVADTQLYKRLCPSVRPSVGPSRSS